MLLDLDGTLSASEPGIAGALVEALVAEGLDPPPAAALRAAIGPPFAVGLPALGVPADRVDAVVARYRARYDTVGLFQTTLFPGVVAMLDALRGAGVVLALATSKPEALAGRVVAHLGIDGHLAAVAGAGTGGVRADKASVIARALDLLGVAPGPDVVMVGDRHHDVDGARVHGLDTIVAAWGYGASDEHRAAEPYAVAATPADVVRLVLGPAPAGPGPVIIAGDADLPGPS